MDGESAKFIEELQAEIGRLRDDIRRLKSELNEVRLVTAGPTAPFRRPESKIAPFPKRNGLVGPRDFQVRAALFWIGLISRSTCP